MRERNGTGILQNWIECKSLVQCTMYNIQYREISKTLNLHIVVIFIK